jgi:hypothetical protein
VANASNSDATPHTRREPGDRDIEEDESVIWMNGSKCLLSFRRVPVAGGYYLPQHVKLLQTDNSTQSPHLRGSGNRGDRQIQFCRANAPSLTAFGRLRWRSQPQKDRPAGKVFPDNISSRPFKCPRAVSPQSSNRSEAETAMPNPASAGITLAV